MFVTLKGDLVEINQQYLLRRAYNLAANSNDKSTKLGALLIDNSECVLMSGVNSMPIDMVNDPINHERPRKYAITEHAERAAIYAAVKVGLSTNNLIMVTPLAACPDCARAIVLAGIKLIVTHKQAFLRLPERWLEAMAIGSEILEAGGVEHMMFDGGVGAINLLFGETWTP